MRIYSGSYCMCECGVPTGEKDIHGNELFTGDVVQLWHGNYIGTDHEEWLPQSGLTAIVSNQYTSYFDGSIVENEGKITIFTMGIAFNGVQSEEWKVSLVKSHKAIIPGERFPSYGLNYKSINKGDSQ